VERGCMWGGGRLIAALTRGGPGGMPRPIEMHAHDPRRYIGDMLAWTHQALAGERELFTSLFGDDGLLPSRHPLAQVGTLS
jgi:conserved oligomeric Golgi complex subunit 6